MPLVVPVKFTYASRDLWFDPQDLDILEADYAICSTERGTEIGLVTADPFEVPQDEIGQPLKPVLRVASDIDLQLADDLAIQGDEAMVDFRRLVKELDLEMKPVGVEYLFGGEKAVFYFAAEERVDFRQLVKDLSSTLHIRVDMRQIGVRDETRLVGGYAQCGQELCCTRFGGQFEPVSIRMAKEQDLPLNSSKISGVCGRLMCCLRYEFEAYKDFKSRAPKKKTLIDTPLGKARIQEYDTPREQLVLRLENGKVFKVNLADMTCSEGCKKKAAEQGCNCRPDCVTRDVLERIESPEMRLALMELDRENGVEVHAQITDAALLARMKALGLQAYIQPIFIEEDMGIITQRVGEKRARECYNWRSMLELGLAVSGGSDCPVEPFDVLDNLRAAVTRQDRAGERTYLPEQALSLEEGLSLFTSRAAWASRDEEVRGRLMPGMQGDLVILDGDLFAVSPQELPKVPVFETVLAGKTVFAKKV